MRHFCCRPSAPLSSRVASFRQTKVYVRAESKTFEWRYQKKLFEIPYDVVGDGKGDVLCFPAINLASTRKELRPLIHRLAPSVTSVVCDWPGFGDASRFNTDYSPELFLDFMLDFIKAVMKKDKMSVLASGHASGYVLKLAQDHPTLFSSIALLAPTYRAPAKAIGMNAITATLLRSAFKTPILGDWFYGRTIEPSFIKKQYEKHVFIKPSSITDDFLQDRYDVVNKSGGQYGPSHFFTGLLDVIETREEFAAMLQSVKCPLKILYGESSPASSLAEMQALESCGVDVVRLPGSLGLCEEFAEEVSTILLPFLKNNVAHEL